MKTFLFINPEEKQFGKWQRDFSISAGDFSNRILKRYRFVPGFSRAHLYFLQFPKEKQPFHLHYYPRLTQLLPGSPAALYMRLLERELQLTFALVSPEQEEVVSKFTTHFSSMLQLTSRLLRSSTEFIAGGFETQLLERVQTGKRVTLQYRSFISRKIETQLLKTIETAIASRYTHGFTRLLERELERLTFPIIGPEPGEAPAEGERRNG